jgi:hypothetical protein
VRGRQTRGLDRALDPGDERFAGCRRMSTQLRAIWRICARLSFHGERDVEQSVVNAPTRRSALRVGIRGVAAGANEVGSQGDDFLGRLVGDRQSLRQRRDRRAQRIAGVMTDRGDTLFRHSSTRIASRH